MARKKETKEQLLHGKGIFMYLRSVLVSQLSGFTDFLFSFIFFAFIGFNSAWSTALGAVCGGIVNCIVNYKFTFRTRESSYLAIGVKFFMVWVGSLLLNTFGTQAFNSVLQESYIMDQLGTSTDFRFLFARILVSLVVSVFWNFMLQRFFVFRSSPIDRYIDRLNPHISIRIVGPLRTIIPSRLRRK